MQIRTTILVTVMFAFVLFMTSSWSVGPVNKGANVASDSTADALVRYGNYVFEREKCLNCHSTGQTTDSNLIRLDGVGRKYPLYWLYYRLVDPGMVVINSNMPTFAHLDRKPISEQQFYAIVPGAGKPEWTQLLGQADTIFSLLQRDMAGRESTTELVALLAWLIKLPPDADRRKEDSLAHIASLNRKHKLDSLISDPKTMSNLKLTDTKSINRGRILFETSCYFCHGTMGKGEVGPNLTDDYWKHCSSTTDIVRIILFGKESVAMPAFYNIYGVKEAAELAAYIRSLKGTASKEDKKPQGEKRVW